MTVLIIPDIHLKPWIFDRAHQMLLDKKADRAVCLMDIPDDFGKEFHFDLYRNTFDAVIRFAKDHPDTLWCYGNHDLCYKWNKRESGYSLAAAYLVQEKLSELERAVLDYSGQPIRYVQRIDHVLFCHGGICQYFIDERIPNASGLSVAQILETINAMDRTSIWTDCSPIWYRPQDHSWPLFEADRFLQVVGHTPMKQIERKGNLLSCDVFSTTPDGFPIGTQEFAIVDTETWESENIR